MRTTITLPEALLSDIDVPVGPLGRSGFLARAARNELKRERRRRALDAARGAMVDTSGDLDPRVTRAGAANAHEAV